MNRDDSLILDMKLDGRPSRYVLGPLACLDLGRFVPYPPPVYLMDETVVKLHPDWLEQIQAGCGHFPQEALVVSGGDTAKTLAKQDRLLLVLEHPQGPLHNNPAELAVRQRVRQRDISFGPRTDDGIAAWDTFNTLNETAKKLGVNFYAYVHDRVADARNMPSLASLIPQRSYSDTQEIVPS